MKKAFVLVFGLSLTMQSFACNYSVDGEERVVKQKKTLDLSGKTESDIIQTVSVGLPTLKEGYYYQDDFESLRSSAEKKCDEIQNKLAKNPNIVIQTFSCKSERVYSGHSEKKWWTQDQSSEHIYTYKLAYSYQEYIPQLSKSEIAEAQIKKIDSCLKVENNSKKVLRLMKKRKELEMDLNT